MDADRGPGAVLTPTFRTVAETGSTNADLLALARDGAEEGLWLRADRQTGGRGRQGRAWASPPGNLYASTLVRVRAGDPLAPGLALVAGVALEESVRSLFTGSPSPFRGFAAPSLSQWEREGARPAKPGGKGEGGLTLKWPNDLLLSGAKLSGILLERADDAVVIGFGVNLAHAPELPDRRTASLAEAGVTITPDAFLPCLADALAAWISRWRTHGLAPVRERWLARAHPVGTPFSAHLPDGERIEGAFAGLDASGALLLGLADGGVRVIHAADVFPL